MQRRRHIPVTRTNWVWGWDWGFVWLVSNALEALKSLRCPHQRESSGHLSSCMIPKELDVMRPKVGFVLVQALKRTKNVSGDELGVRSGNWSRWMNFCFCMSERSTSYHWLVMKTELLAFKSDSYEKNFVVIWWFWSMVMWWPYIWMRFAYALVLTSKIDLILVVPIWTDIYYLNWHILFE